MAHKRKEMLERAINPKKARARAARTKVKFEKKTVLDDHSPTDGGNKRPPRRRKKQPAAGAGA